LIHNCTCLIVMKTLVVFYLRMEMVNGDENELVEIVVKLRQL
jgi:hypothetical protein